MGTDFFGIIERAASYLTHLGLPFLIWRLATLSFVWYLPVRRFSGGFPVICSILYFFVVGCFGLKVEEDFGAPGWRSL